MVIIKNDTNRIKDSLALKTKPKKKKPPNLNLFMYFRKICVLIWLHWKQSLRQGCESM